MRNQNLSRRILKVLSLVVVVFFAFSCRQTGKEVYNNPIIPGFNPDPSICRVGDDYYLVTSSFEYYPGVPVYHSRDLVNWEIMGYCLNTPSQLNLDSIRCSGGIFAPTIRYHEGTFYMITTLVGGLVNRGNFIVTAKDPAGPWSEPHWIADAPGIDPSLFFDDDGKAYYSGNVAPETKLWEKHRNIWVQEIDLKNWKLVGPRVDVLDGGEYYKKGTLDGGIESGMNNYEGSHLYKKDGKYYMMISHGGTSQNHAVSIWKSDHVFGPYELNPDNPILTHRDLSPEHDFTSTGHADLVQTQHGDWWIVYLAKRPYGGVNHILGRETFISPVDWSGVWPVVNPEGNRGRGELTHAKPDLSMAKVNAKNRKDEFDDTKLAYDWTFIRTPRTQWWSLGDREGFLRIRLRPETIAEQVNPSFIGVRQDKINCSVSARMEFVPAAENEEAGLLIERDKDDYFKFVLGKEGGRTVLSLVQRAGVEALEEVVAQKAVDATAINLKVASEGVLYTFSYSVDGGNWETLMEKADGSFLGVAEGGRFTGTFIGMYASSNGSGSGNYADFDWFER